MLGEILIGSCQVSRPGQRFISSGWFAVRLFDLDNRLYHAEGDLSVAYGGGLHSKHRHIRYYDFFSARFKQVTVS